MADEKPRKEQRTRAVMRAQLRHADGDGEASILDISTRGMLLMMANAPGRGEFVEIVVAGHPLAGHVRWKFGKRFGVALRERISVAALLAGDSSSIRLAASAASQRRRGGLADALSGDRRSLGRLVQFVLVIAALGGAAWLLADYAGDGLQSVQVAREAMAHRRDG